MEFLDGNCSRSNILSEILIFDQSSFCDQRGSLWTAYHNNFKNYVPEIEADFIHDKFVTSKKNVLRGIHGDSKTWKLVTPIYGKIQQVVVDLRKDSATYKNHISLFIDASQEHRSVLIPPGFGNAYLSITDTVYYYKLAYEGKYFDAIDQFTYKWNDPDIKINWISDFPILSERDA